MEQFLQFVKNNNLPEIKKIISTISLAHKLGYETYSKDSYYYIFIPNVGKITLK